jgi:RNA polymerase sigma-70 factor (ECF subfamily)
VLERKQSDPARDDLQATAERARRIARSSSGGARADEDALYRQFAPRIRMFGLRHLRDPGAADDLVQEVILQTFQSLRAGQVREPERLASFVLGTCRLMVRNFKRTRERRAELLERWTPPPEHVESMRADPEHLDECLHRLSERERTVLALTFYAERSASEIATELAISEGNVRVIRHRALEGLAGCLARAGGDA